MSSPASQVSLLSSCKTICGRAIIRLIPLLLKHRDSIITSLFFEAATAMCDGTSCTGTWIDACAPPPGGLSDMLRPPSPRRPPSCCLRFQNQLLRYMHTCDKRVLLIPNVLKENKKQGPHNASGCFRSEKKLKMQADTQGKTKGRLALQRQTLAYFYPGVRYAYNRVTGHPYNRTNTTTVIANTQQISFSRAASIFFFFHLSCYPPQDLRYFPLQTAERSLPNELAIRIWVRA